MGEVTAARPVRGAVLGSRRPLYPTMNEGVASVGFALPLAEGQLKMERVPGVGISTALERAGTSMSGGMILYQAVRFASESTGTISKPSNGSASSLSSA